VQTTCGGRSEAMVAQIDTRQYNSGAPNEHVAGTVGVVLIVGCKHEELVSHLGENKESCRLHIKANIVQTHIEFLHEKLFCMKRLRGINVVWYRTRALDGTQNTKVNEMFVMESCDGVHMGYVICRIWCGLQTINTRWS